MNSKFIRFLIIINGLIIPIVMGILLFQLTKEFFPKKNNEGIIIGEKLQKAKKDSVALQGLTYYSEPEKLYNSTNFYLPISLKDYEKEKELDEVISVANDIGDTFLNLVNVIFLDKDYQVIGSLLDKKASISKIYARGKYYSYKNDKIDETVKNIGYLIGFEDSNRDQKLNSLDNHDLYISDLNGKKLTQVTKNIDIQQFEFINSNSQILIFYTKRENIREEHKKREFAIYTISSGTFLNLSSLNNELDKLEKIILN